MNEKNKNIKPYSAADIQRYLKGQMSAQEMYAIETAALEDPFLADAIEGFGAAMATGNEASINTGLEKLNKQFSERVKQPGKVVSIYQTRWWQIAAAALMLIITGIAFYNNWMRPEQNNNALAVIEKEKNDSAGLQKRDAEKSSSSATFLDAQKNQDTLSAPPAGHIENESAKNSINHKTPGLSVKTYEKRDDQVTKKSERSEKAHEEVSTKPAITDRDYREQQTATAFDSPETISRRNNQLAEHQNNFSGRVVDPDNKPLPNASLKILNNKISLITDQSGNFNFTTKDSVVEVQVGLPGFEQRNFRLQNSIASNQLVLEPSKQNLDEVVISGYGTERKKNITDTKKMRAKVHDAVPQTGWIEYEKYLEKNKKPPATNPLMTGEVIVSFQVKSDGVLSDFKIEKSLSKDFDAEAIRLIQEGPAWRKVLKHRKTRTRVSVKF